MTTLIGNFFYKWMMLKRRLMHHYLLKRYRNNMKSVGEGVRFNGICKVTGAENIEIEDNVHIGDNAFIRGEGGLFIGANTHTSRNLVIYTHNHNYEGEVLPYDNSFRYRKVVIERNVWIGMNVVILPGAHIGEGAIVGAGCVVSGHVEPLAILGAVPGKVLKHRNKEHYEKLNKEKRFGGKNGNPISSD